MKRALLLLFISGCPFFVVAQTGAWTRISNIDTTSSAPAGKTEAVGLAVSGKGYVGTGTTGSNTSFTADVESYDPSTDQWSAAAVFGGASRVGAVAFSIGSFGYIGTGSDNTASPWRQDFWQYDPGTDTWSQKADVGGGGRTLAVGFSIGGFGYIGTGENQFGDKNDFWQYDPTANTWTQKANFAGGARFKAVGFSVGNFGYIGTGNDPVETSTPTFYKDLWQYDPSTNTWTQKADFGGGTRALASAFSAGSYGYVGMGNAGIGSDGLSTSGQKDLWQYDPTANTWTRENDLPGVFRWSAVSFSANGVGYVGLGYSGACYTCGSVQKDFWKYDPAATICRSALGTYMSPSPCPVITGSNFDWETDDQGGLVYGVDAGTNNLGATCWGTNTLAAGDYRQTYGWFGGASKLFGAYLTRNYVLTPTTEPGSNVTLRFYCTTQEISDFVSAFNSAYGTSYTSADIRVIRYDGANQDLDLTNDDDNAAEYTALTPTIGAYGSADSYFEVTTPSLSEFAIALSSPSAPLGFTLLNFTAVYHDPSTALSWQTTQEENTVSFSVQRSVDGRNFTTVGSVPAAGQSSTTLDYHFTDATASQAGSPILYYRLAETDLSGRINFSPVAVVRVDAPGVFAVYPNPATDHVFVQVTTSASKGKLTVTDVAGRTIAVEALTLQDGFNSLYLSTGNWAPGLYYLKLSTDSGSWETKLLKQ